MTAEQIRRLRKSFHQLERNAELAAPLFYEQLFALDPGLSPLFKTDVELQSIKLMSMLGSAVELLDAPAELEETLIELGSRLSEYGLRPRHYATIGSALTTMLEEVLGETYTLEVRQAWVALYHRIAGTMLGYVAQHAAAA
ncbi:globin domain-containing protein [Haloferula sp. BvORR071]|uniref:globin domain-containing protein n=1 Tax=Haloferula sp. BvORR071 TaxID=1396141 RepID=UPI00054D13A0|nr:globin domain-containing protein [Haloferula sp. BvORR071]